MTAEYYVWKVDGKPVQVRLNLTVVDRLQALVAHAFRMMPDHQMAGLLIGHTERHSFKRVVVVDDFEPIDTSDRPAVGRRVHELGDNVVGLFRSHAGEALRLDEQDAGLIERFFNDPAMVYLLVRPAPGEPSTAAFFIQEHGKMLGYAPYLEFPFHSDLLRSGDPLLNRAAGAERETGRPLPLMVPAAAGVLIALAITPWLVRRPAQASTATQPPVAAISQPAATAAQGEDDRSKPSPVDDALTGSSTPSMPGRTAAPKRSEVAAVSVEPVQPRRGVMERIPGFRRWSHRRDARFVPARPVREVAPAVPPDLRASLKTEVPVSLKLRIDKRGNVADTKVLASNSDELTQLATSAADRWRFAPARLNDQPVPSEVVLHFHFRAEE